MEPVAPLPIQAAASTRPSVRRLAAATPASRDRFVDLVRAFAILSVVVGHWTMAVIFWQNGRITGENALALVKGAWIGTWVFQVMPLFFFVGGFANATTLSGAAGRGMTYADYGRARAIRLLRPVVVFGGVWAVAGLLLPLTGLSQATVDLGTRAVAQPLWFLGAFLAVIAMAPTMMRAHRRFRIRALLALAVGAGLVDGLRFGLHRPAIGLLNYLLVWLFAQQMGFFYQDGSLLRLPRRAYGAMAVGGLLALTALGVKGPYPSSMVGVSTDPISNMDPPTLVITALAVWQVGLAMLVRPALTRWAARARPWAAVVLVNTRIMTIFLWHLTAMILGVVILLPLGFPQPEAGTTEWWLLRVPWVLALGVILVPLVMLFGRFERGRDRPRAVDARGDLRLADRLVAGAVVYAAAAIVGFSFTGFSPLLTRAGASIGGIGFNPLLSVVHLAASLVLLAAAARAAWRLRAAVGLAVGFAALAIVGGVMVGNPSWNFLHANGGDVALHAATAVALAGAAAETLLRRRGSAVARAAAA